MERKDILKSPEYWIASIQIMLYNCADKFMRATGKNRTQLAEHLGVTKGYVSQLLNGDYDHKISKFVELSLAFGYVPKVEFVPVDEYLKADDFMKNKKELYNSNYETAYSITPTKITNSCEFGVVEGGESSNAA